MASNTPRPTKAERRAAARAKAQALREEQERRERRLKITRRVLLGGGVVAAVGATAALVIASRRADAGNSQTPEDAGHIPAGVGADGSLTYGAAMTPGSVNEGAPVLDVYFDYACHFCANFDTLHADEISRLVKDGKITLALHPCKILDQDWTDIVMNAMGVVLDEQPEMALTFHNAALALFSEIFASRDAGRQTVDELADTAKKAGVSRDVVKAFEKAVKDNSYGKWTEAGTNAFKDKKLSATPTVFLADTQLNLQAIATATALTEAVAKLPAATATPTEAASGAPTGAATETPAEGGAEGGAGAPAEGGAGAPAAPSPEPAE